MEAGALSGMCYRIICQQHTILARTLTLQQTVLSVLISCLRNGRERYRFQFAHNIHVYRAAVFVGRAIKILAGGHRTNRYGGCWFDSAPTVVWSGVIAVVIIRQPVAGVAQRLIQCCEQ